MAFFNHQKTRKLGTLLGKERDFQLRMGEDTGSKRNSKNTKNIVKNSARSFRASSSWKLSDEKIFIENLKLQYLPIKIKFRHNKFFKV